MRFSHFQIHAIRRIKAVKRLSMIRRHHRLALVVSACIVVSSSVMAGTFPDARSAPPTGWSGPVFKLSQDYPTNSPPNDAQSFLAIDFVSRPYDYSQAVLAYVLEGNVTPGKPNAAWVVQDNQIRKWYHAPWMHAGPRGREFIHGLTRERSSCPGQLSDQQTDWFQSWAIGIYNAQGGYTIGRVWQDASEPDPSKSIFPVGTVSAKLLFTSASIRQVPYLKGAPIWLANINETTRSAQRMPRNVRLIQFDIAVRDARANATTGWVFGTYVYDGNQSGSDPWRKLVPVGLMWGNNPTISSAQPFRRGQFNPQLTETWLNTSIQTKQHYGRGGRLNGPLDDSTSSCLSCHATAQVPALSPINPQPRSPHCGPLVDDWQEQKSWFRNIQAGRAFDPSAVSTDYSLQIPVGIGNLKRWLGNYPSHGN